MSIDTEPVRERNKVLSYLEPHRGGRFAALDGYRAVAACGVLVYHVAGYSGLATGDSVLNRFLYNLGNFGVAVFFLLSGFLLYRPFVMTWFREEPAPDPIVFLRHRVLRIFPAYWIALTGFIALGLLSAPHAGPDHYFTLYALIQTYRPAFGFAGLPVAWTLCIELSFYLALPLIAAGIRVIGRSAHTIKMKLEAQLIGLGMLVLICLIYRVLVAAPKQADEKFAVEHLWLPNYLDWFALGMLLAVCVVWIDLGRDLPRVVQRFADTGWLCWLVGAACYATLMVIRTSSAAAGGGGFAKETTSEMALRFLFNGLAAFFFLLPAIVGRREHNAIDRVLGSAVPVYLGTVSYGIYLWHKIWLAQIAQDHDTTATRLSFWVMLGLVFGATVLTASVSYYAIEKPLMRFKDPRRLRRRAPARIEST